MDKYTRELMTLIKENFKDVIGDKNFQNNSDARSFYLVDLVDNICEPMGDKALRAYGQGSGNEIASGKMNALRSSSALTYNLFGNAPAKIGDKEYSVEFEKQYHTLKPSVPGKPARRKGRDQELCRLPFPCLRRGYPAVDDTGRKGVYRC